MAGSVRGRTTRSAVPLMGEEDSPDNYCVRIGTQGDGGDEIRKGSPRHRHNFDQIRYPLRGDHPIAPDQVIPEGWVGYFPEGTFYGPYGPGTMPLTMLVIQFGGPSGEGFASVAQVRKGLDALNAKGGKLEDGMYLWEDEEGKRHAQDAFEATWENIYERKIDYPAERFSSFILMNPASFAWVKDRDASGVAHKWLGSFSEREVRIGFVGLDKGASLNFGTEPAGEMMFLQEGALSHNGTDHPTRTCFATAAGDAPETLTAIEDSELFYLKLPTF
jgi:hypothetical protein